MSINDVYEFEDELYHFANGKWFDHRNIEAPVYVKNKLNMLYRKGNISSQKNNLKKKEAIKSRKEKEGNFGIAKARPITEYKLTSEQEKALTVLESGINVFLSGEAGTGKSFVLNEYIRRNKDHKKIIVCAPTGIAAISVGGSTIHRVFGVPIGNCKPNDYNRKPSDAVVEADVVIIDEISMCRFDLFEFVIHTIQRAENLRNTKVTGADQHKQIIVVGDFFQLPPVLSSSDREQLQALWNSVPGDGFAFQSDVWNELHFCNVFLHEIVRQQGEEEFVQNLNKIRIGNADGIEWFNENIRKEVLDDGIFLCGTNEIANKLNSERIGALPGIERAYPAVLTGTVENSDKMTLDTLILKKDMQVMTLVNNTIEGYQNGSIGKIVSLNNGSVDIVLGNGIKVNVSPYEWEITNYEMKDDKLVQVVIGKFKQLPIKPAYAITIHKSQGQTFSRVNVIPDCFAPGQLYVALSRITSAKNMSLSHAIKHSSLRTSNAVKQFYMRFDNAM